MLLRPDTLILGLTAILSLFPSSSRARGGLRDKGVSEALCVRAGQGFTAQIQNSPHPTEHTHQAHTLWPEHNSWSSGYCLSLAGVGGVHLYNCNTTASLTNGISSVPTGLKATYTPTDPQLKIEGTIYRCPTRNASALACSEYMRRVGPCIVNITILGLAPNMVNGTVHKDGGLQSYFNEQATSGLSGEIRCSDGTTHLVGATSHVGGSVATVRSLPMSLGEHGGAWLAAVRPTSGGVNATRPPTHPTGRLLFALDCPDDGRGVCEQYQPCSTNGTCEERSIFGYSCRCNNGYIGDGKVCRQADWSSTELFLRRKVFNPCMYNNGGCAHTCLPRANTVTCSCREGYRLEGRKKCVDVDECSESPCHVGATCKNTDGSFQCTCRDGYTGDGIVCVGATPTSTCGPHVCHPNATCVALRGNFQCVCNDAYKGDGITCREKDPCEHAGHACGQNAACRPTANGHACQCVPGYVLLGGACAKRIPSSTVPVVSQEKIVAVVATEI